MGTIAQRESENQAAVSRPTSKAPAQREKILELLRSRGPRGVTNQELNEIGFRYGARLWELRRQGFDIETVAEGEAVFRFILHAEPRRASSHSEKDSGPESDWYAKATGKPRPSGRPEPPPGKLPLFEEVRR